MAEREKITEWIIRHNKYWDELWDFTKAAPDSKKTYIAKCIENYGYHKHASDDKVADGEKKVLNGRRGNERDYWKVCTRVAIDPDGCHLIGIMEDDGLSLRNRHNLIELMNRHFISIENGVINMRTSMDCEKNFTSSFINRGEGGRMINTPYDNISSWGRRGDSREKEGEQYEALNVYNMGIRDSIILDVSSYTGICLVSEGGKRYINGNNDKKELAMKILDTLPGVIDANFDMTLQYEMDKMAVGAENAENNLIRIVRNMAGIVEKECANDISLLKNGSLRYKLGTVNDFTVYGDKYRLHQPENQLTNMNGFPEHIRGSFAMRYLNSLQDMEGFPKMIEGCLYLQEVSLPAKLLPKGIHVCGNLVIAGRESNIEESYRILCTIAQSDIQVDGIITSRLYTGPLDYLRKLCVQKGWRV